MVKAVLAIVFCLFFLFVPSWSLKAEEYRSEEMKIVQEIFESSKEKYSKYWKSRSLLWVCDKDDMFHLLDPYEHEVEKYTAEQMAKADIRSLQEVERISSYVNGMQVGYLSGITEAYAGFFEMLSGSQDNSVRDSFCMQGVNLAEEFLGSKN